MTFDPAQGRATVSQRRAAAQLGHEAATRSGTNVNIHRDIRGIQRKPHRATSGGTSPLESGILRPLSRTHVTDNRLRDEVSGGSQALAAV